MTNKNKIEDYGKSTFDRQVMIHGIMSIYDFVQNQNRKMLESFNDVLIKKYDLDFKTPTENRNDFVKLMNNDYIKILKDYLIIK